MQAQDKQTNRIGLIGLGLVGTALAEVLLEKGFQLTGFDIDAERRQLLQERGGKVAASVGELVASVDCLMLSLPDSSVVDRVMTGEDGVLQSETLPACCIDTTTGDPEETVRIERLCAERNMFFLDATISGSSKQIARRQGVFMVGGDEKAFKMCRPVLDVLSDEVFYLGPSGSGSRAKLAGNLILGLNRAALAEGLVFAEELGLDLESFPELTKQTPAYSAVMDTKGAKMIRADFTCESRIRQHRKDVALILKYAEKAHRQLPLSAVHLDLLDKAIAAGDADLDNAAIIRELKRRHTAPPAAPARDNNRKKA
ncbi:MAG: NAD(P)-dependent oxidoreductase [Planctomycetes bacterium]|nr:NAD(P)-dependent oxidoreductase [Planctomycetota bacterium]